MKKRACLLAAAFSIFLGIEPMEASLLRMSRTLVSERGWDLACGVVPV